MYSIDLTELSSHVADLRWKGANMANNPSGGGRIKSIGRVASEAQFSRPVEGIADYLQLHPFANRISTMPKFISYLQQAELSCRAGHF